MCTPVENQPPLGERLAPIGQEHDNELSSLPSKPAGLRNSLTIANAAGQPCRSQPPLTPVKCPVPPFEDGDESKDSIPENDSPPDIQEHTISTPIHPRLKTPSFNLSKVVKPVYDPVEYEVPNKPDDAHALQENVNSKVSTFNSSKIAVAPVSPLRKSDNLQDPLINVPTPPFSRNCVTLPRLVHINSPENNPVISNQATAATLPCTIS